MDHGIEEDPYYRRNPANYRACGQLKIPKAGYSILPFSSFICEGNDQLNGGLVVIKDWDTYPPNQMILLDGLRNGHGETRPLIEAPGHLFTSDESPLISGIFGLTIIFQWTAYLYFPSKNTFLNWEGELLDCWLNSTDEVAELATRVKDTFKGVIPEPYQNEKLRP